ncbi:MAG: hypothetical protein EB023_02325 [Flavobacteriia bacterium]|nr:hypothetical protein [Flavobacteriia bacterium]
MKNIVFDLESDHLIEKATTIHCLVLTDMDTGETKRFNHQPNGQPVASGIRLLQQAETIVGHNIIGFDIPVIQKLYKGFLSNGKVVDTLIMTRLVFPDLKDLDFGKLNSGFPKELIGSHSLKAWGIRIGLHKGDFKESSNFEVWSPAMEDYCVQDVAVTLKLYRMLCGKNPHPRSVDLEHAFARIINKQESHGFKFDVKKAEELCLVLQKRRAELESGLQSVFPPDEEEMKSNLWMTIDGKEWTTKKEAVSAGYKAKEITKGGKKKKIIPFNPGSRDQIANRFIAKGWKPEEFTPDGKPKVDEQVLTALEGMGYAEAKPLLEYLLVTKRLGQLAEGNEAWLKLVKNGRMHGRVITNGAVTGRCTHRNPNMAQVPRVGSAYGKECRSLFVSNKETGFSLVGADASGLELRCLAHFMAPYDGGRYAKILLEGDIHTANQEAAGLPDRNSAKTFIYAFLYGAGSAKIGSIIGKGEREGKAIIDKFQRQLPAIKRLKDAVELAVNSRGYLVGLDGRHLPIRSAHSALNMLLQSAGALIMKQATINFVNAMERGGYSFGRDYALVAHIHDEIQIEAKTAIADATGKQAVAGIRKAGSDFAFRCPLDGEYRIGSNWAETH